MSAAQEPTGSGEQRDPAARHRLLQPCSDLGDRRLPDAVTMGGIGMHRGADVTGPHPVPDRQHHLGQ